VDRHPERRMKAAFAAFEEAHMPRLKMENPNMRLSQLKQMLKKEWTKSPENPLNQRLAAISN
jgi:DNA-binding transcriptional regulator WhiA